MICPKCKKEYFGMEKYCVKCGMRLVEKSRPVAKEAKPVLGDDAQKTIMHNNTPAQMSAFGNDAQETVMHNSMPAQMPAFGNDAQETVMHNSMPAQRPVFGNDAQETVMHNSMPVQTSAFGNDEQATVMHSSVPTPTPIPVATDSSDHEHRKVTEIKSFNQIPVIDGMKTTQKIQGRKSSGVKTVVLIIVAILFFVLAGGTGFLIIKSGIISQVFNKDHAEKRPMEEQVQEDEINLEELNALLSEADELLKLGMEQIESDETIYDGLNHLEDAIAAYLEKLSELNDPDFLADKIDIAYSAYQTAVYSRVSMLNENAIGGADTGARFDQMIEDLKHAIALGNKIEDAGFEVDYEDIEALIDEVRTEYPKRVIEEFNTYSGEKLLDGNWSRTEAYNLMCGNEDMVGTEGMFDADDFDDPVHTRYCFALAYYQIKLLNKAVHEEKTQTPGAAAQSIAGVLPAVDYSPLLVSQYIGFRKEAELDYGEAEEALNDVKVYLKDGYGIDIDEIGWEHFWYFNEIGSDSSQTVADGDWNGVTPESRQWIRDRLSSVSY